MATVEISKKACTVNPLKMSQPIGGALAFMGVKGCMPLLHGIQGCTSFGLVLFVRHFREAIPMQTTAMSEVATVLGGFENVEQAVVTIANRAKPAMIGICSTGVTETKGDDVDGFITLIRQHQPELDRSAARLCLDAGFQGRVSGRLGEDGHQHGRDVLVERPAADATRAANRVNILPGCHLTPGDLDELRDIVEAFGLEPSFLPDLSGSLDGHIPDDFTPTTLGGISVEEIARMGRAAWTIAIGEQMRDAAEALEKKTGVPFELFDRLTGLAPNDAFIGFLAHISGRPCRQISPPAQPARRRDARRAFPFRRQERSPSAPSRTCSSAISSWLRRWAAASRRPSRTTQSPVLEKVADRRGADRRSGGSGERAQRAAI